MAGKLYLHEEITLLALRDRTGTLLTATYNYAVAGAVLAELLLRERVRVEAHGRKKLIELVAAQPLGDPLLDECLEKVVAAKRRATPQSWVCRFAQVRQLKHRVAGKLCQLGILRADEAKVLLIFRRKIYPELDPRPERELKERLRKAIFTETAGVDARTVILVSLAQGAGLLPAIFDRKQVRERKQRIARLTSGEIAGKATRDAIAAMQAAVMVSTMMPAITAASASH